MLLRLLNALEAVASAQASVGCTEQPEGRGAALNGTVNLQGGLAEELCSRLRISATNRNARDGSISSICASDAISAMTCSSIKGIGANAKRKKPDK